MATWKTILFGELIKTNGNANSFHANLNEKIKDIVNPGQDTGMMIFFSLPNTPHPSIIAASSRASGMVSKCAFRIKMFKGIMMI